MVKSGKLGGKLSGKFENAYGRAGLFLDIEYHILFCTCVITQVLF